MVILCAAMFCNGAIYGGSLTNAMDLAVNFAGTISGLSGTLTGLMAILGPTTVGYITYGQQTRAAWRLVFYVSAAIIGTPFFVYLFFGSVEEQPWNKPKEETDKGGTRPHQQDISVSQRV
uniref:(California timema) hypothetical protein n=1 Tax=Timema californicum TaxID=61474 RepID=A0A7R9PGD0_TIMCA|nr:unnamed protein product [Timema californicum]